MSANTYSFRPVTAADYRLLRGWLQQAHMRAWWGDPDTELGYIRDMVEGRDTTRPFIFEADGRALGYIQYWFIGHHQNESWLRDHPWLAELPSDAIGVDLSIGEADALGQGIGSAALAAFVAGLLAEGHQTIIIDPDAANERAVRAYAKAGFRPVPYLVGNTGEALIMMYDVGRAEVRSETGVA